MGSFEPPDASNARKLAAVVTSGSGYITCTHDWSAAATTCTDGAGNYGDNEDATVNLQGLGTLTFTSFSLEPDSSCSYDYIEIDGTKYCGSTAPATMTIASGTTKVLRWRSDNSVTDAGFEFKFLFK